MTVSNKPSTCAGKEKVCIDPSPPVTQDADLRKRVDGWARHFIETARQEHGGRLPKYGSPDWGNLPANHRWASVLVAAECWRQECDPARIAAALLEEREQRIRFDKQVEDQEYQANAARHRELWSDAGKRQKVIAAEVETEYKAWLNDIDRSTTTRRTKDTT